MSVPSCRSHGIDHIHCDVDCNKSILLQTDRQNNENTRTNVSSFRSSDKRILGHHAQGAIKSIHERENPCINSIIHILNQYDRYHVMNAIIEERKIIETDLREANIKLDVATEAVMTHENQLKLFNDVEQVILHAKPSYLDSSTLQSMIAGGQTKSLSTASAVGQSMYYT